MGAICHTINPRLFPEQIAYIVNHAEDKYIFMDLTFVPLIEAVVEHIPNVKGFIIMTDEAAQSIDNNTAYEVGNHAADNGFEIFVFALENDHGSFTHLVQGDQSHLFVPVANPLTVFQQIKQIFEDICVGE